METWLVALLLTLLAGPVVAYFTVKLGTLGYLAARQAYREYQQEKDRERG